MTEPTTAKLNCEDCGIEVARLCWPCFIKRVGGDEAAARAVGINPEDGEARCDCDGWKVSCRCDFAAVDGVPAARAAGIDAETLARALHARCVTRWRQLAISDPTAQTTMHNEDAHNDDAIVVAAEYARLAAEKERP